MVYLLVDIKTWRITERGARESPRLGRDAQTARMLGRDPCMFFLGRLVLTGQQHGSDRFSPPHGRCFCSVCACRAGHMKRAERVSDPRITAECRLVSLLW